jgi:branched-chain amino acid transport system substrate-binding protein
MGLVLKSIRCLAVLTLLVARPPTAAASLEPFVIYAILPLTGSGAFLGNAATVSLRAAESVINQTGGIRHQAVKFVVEDDQSNPTVAVQLTSALIAKHTAAMIGPFLAATCSAVVPTVGGSGPVQYCLSPQFYPSAGSYSFSAGSASRDSVLAALRFVRQRGWHRVALLTSTSATGQDAERYYREGIALAANAALSVVANEHFAESALGVTTQLTRIQAAKPDVLYVGATGTPFGQVLRDLVQIGFDVPIISSSGNATSASLGQFTNVLPKELFFSAPVGVSPKAIGAGPLREASSRFQTALKGQGVIPDAGYVYAWDPAMILIEAFRHIGVGATASQVRDYIEHLHGFVGINGVYDFRDGSQRGLSVNANMLVRFDPKTKAFIPVTRPGGQKLN